MKAVGTASKILESLGLIEGGVSGATMTLSVALVIGAKWAIEGFSGLAAMLFGTDEEKEAAREKAENSGIWWTLGSGIAGALNSALDGAVEMAISLKNNVAEMWSNIKQWWSDYVDRVGENLQCFVEVANQAKEWWSNVKQWWSERVGNVAEFWTGVKNNASAWWSNVCDWWSERVGNVAEFWTGVKNNASAWWSNVKQWWSDIVSGKSLSFEAAISLVKDGWETVRGWVADNVGGVFEFLIDLAIPEWLQELLGIDKVDKKVNVSVAGTTNSVYEGLVKSMGGTLSGTVQKTANAVLKGSKGSGFSNITTYNNTKNKSVNLKVGVRKNGATTVSVKPSSGIIGGMVKKILGSTNLFSLRFAARGGIVDSATLFGNTVMGEAGKEAIIPLENHTEWLDKVADRVARRVERNGGEQTINVYVTLDGTIVGKSVVRYVNGVAKSTGVNPLSAYI